MESIHQTVKVTDGMLRALIQRLSNQLDTMGSAGSDENLACIGKQLKASLTEVQRVHERLEASLARSIEHEKATKEAAQQERASAESALVTDKLAKLAAIFGSPGTATRVDDGNDKGDKTLSRMEAKLDTIIAKLDKPNDNSEREAASAVEAQQASIQENEIQNPTAIDKMSQQLTAMQATLLQLKNQAVVNRTAQTINKPDGPIVQQDHEETGRKKRRVEALEAEHELLQLSDDEQRWLAEFRNISNPMVGILERLVPTSCTASRSTSGIVSALQQLWAEETSKAHELLGILNRYRLKEWRCVSHGVLEKEVQEYGSCFKCVDNSLQIMPLETEGDGVGRKFRVRLVPAPPPLKRR